MSATDTSTSFLRSPEWFQRFTKGNTKSRWQPIPQFSWTVGFFVVITLIALPLGGSMFYSSKQNISFTHRYDNFEVPDEKKLDNVQRLARIRGPNGVSSQLILEADKKMESPVYVYYELEDYYQNHKRYVRSVSEDQLGGKNPSSASIDRCDPFRFASEDETNDGEDDRQVILPCGLVAHSYFNDSFQLESATVNGETLDLEMEETGIATEWDRKYLYSKDLKARNFNEDPNTRGGMTITGLISDDEHFMVWMRVGARPTVRKLYGIIRKDIPKGANLTFTINNRYNTYTFNGKKKLIVTTANWTGGRNEVTGIVYFVIGTVSAVACIFILFMDLGTNRKAGDLRKLSWNQQQPL